MKHMKNTRRHHTAWLVLVTVLAGCASTVPQAIREEPTSLSRVEQVQQLPEKHLGETVRWGGEIISVRNEKDFTDVELLARPLRKDGQPVTDGEVDARFIGRVSGFLDPAEYAEGRLLTVRGQIIGMETRKVGEYPYPYPLVQVVAFHSWPKPKPEVRYLYDPFYDPWWPHRYWYRYPYWW